MSTVQDPDDPRPAPPSADPVPENPGASRPTAAVNQPPIRPPCKACPGLTTLGSAGRVAGEQVEAVMRRSVATGGDCQVSEPTRNCRRLQSTLSVVSMLSNAPQVESRAAAVLEELARPDRLVVLASTGLMDSPAEEPFDRWTGWLSEALGVPVAVLSLVDDRRQYFKSAAGSNRPDAVAAGSSTPVEGSFGQYVVADARPLVVQDARRDSRLADHAAVQQLRAVAYAGVPVGVDGEVLGALCVTSPEPREWTDAELALLRCASAAVSAELSLRVSAERLTRAHRLVAAHGRVLHLIAERAPLHTVLAELTGYVNEELSGVTARIDASATATASWSAPLQGEDGSVLGRFCVDTEADRQLTDDERDLLADAARLAVIAVGRHRAQEALTHHATHDSVTGLPNRTLLLDRANGALARARRSGASTAVLFVDLDRFKLVNDSLGHDVGDAVLTAVAQRLAASMRPTDTIARFGGDEFVIVAEDLGSRRDALSLADRVRRALQPPIQIASGEPFSITASIGVAVIPAGVADPHDAIRAADTAMYAAKRAGGGKVRIYDEGLRDDATLRLRLQNDLPRALTDGQLWVALQPIIQLEDRHPVGLEALARWDHPELGPVPPMQFIPAAEDTGFIAELGDRVLTEACRATVRLSARLGRPLDIAVNLSPRRLDDAGLAPRITEVLDQTGLPAHRLVLEITESALLDASPGTRQTVRALRARGTRLALDDFGTGYSSLCSLKEHPIDIVKIDRAFVAGVANDVTDRAIVSAVVDMAHALGCDVIGEGVEDETTLASLRELGCDRAQGYLFARPAPELETSAVLSELARTTPTAAS